MGTRAILSSFSQPIIPRLLRARLADFRSDQSGALVILALMLAMLMMMMGGIAVDVMRYESRRTELQNTLDRSTLAAAAMNQDLDPRDVVDDYFLKAGLANELKSVNVTQNATSRKVSATASATTDPLFMQLMGIEEFDANSASTAEQSIGNVEIMLALDVSGSMNDNNKIGKLREAASAFVETVMAGDDDHHVSVGIVPYNAQVNLGPEVRAKFNATHLHGVAGVDCLELPDTLYANTSIPLYSIDPAVPTLPQYTNADLRSQDSTGSYIGPTNSKAIPSFNADNHFCRSEAQNIVRLPNTDLEVLQAQIGGLTADGNTSIFIGMKWASALMDPSLQDTYSEWIDEGEMPATVEDRPAEYGSNGLKVIVLMTDGEHTVHQYLRDDFKSGPSSIWLSATDSNYSVQHTTGRPVAAGANEYYVPHLGTWQATPWGNEDPANLQATRQDWLDVWADLRVSYVASQFYARALGNSYNTEYRKLVTDRYTADDMDDLLQENCAAIRAQDVIIYGIAFQAPSSGQAQIRGCSTDGAAGTHYFNATTLNIATAFQAIAANISQLRLTQ